MELSSKQVYIAAGAVEKRAVVANTVCEVPNI